MRASTAGHCIVKGLRVLRSNTQSSMGSPLRSNSPFPIGKQESEPTLCIRLGTAWFLVPSSESNLRKPRNLSQRRRWVAHNRAFSSGPNGFFEGRSVRPFYVPTVPMSVNDPVAASMLNIETSSESKFVTYANFPDGSMAIELGDDPAATVPIDVKTPVVALRVYMETFEFTFAT